MFVVELRYTEDLKSIDARMRAHIIEFRANQRADDIPQRVEGP